MERESSSDEEDDRQTLIHQNDIIKQSCSSPTTTTTTFHIQDQDHDHDHDDAATHLRYNDYHHQRFSFWGFSGNNNINGRRRRRYLYLLAAFLPLLILILYFITDIRYVFSLNLLNFHNQQDSLSDLMIDSELRALYLLRQQQLSLFALWNQTSTANSNSNSTTLFQDAILNQISFNKQIQQVLLFSHRTGANFSDQTDPTAAAFDDRCRKVSSQIPRRTIQWNPNKNKFLFAICLSGQMSNHLICLEKHMFFAALLNRVLVIPSAKVDYQYNRFLDIQHINACVGRNVVLSFDDFLAYTKNRPRIDSFLCYFSLPSPCFVDEEHVKKLKQQLGLSMGGKLESVWHEDVKKPTKKTLQDVQATFASDGHVIAIGDVFYADLEQDWVMQPGGPIAHNCKTLIEPSRLIMLTAQRFIQTFLGNNFIALHFRRHGFLKFCNGKKPSCFYPIPQAADCITRVVDRANAPVIYLSTDAAESETSLLQSLVVVNGNTIPLVNRPPRNSAEKWDALLYRHGIEGDSQVEAMLDKTICAMSSVFIGASESTFTEDILRLRKDWGSASMCDEYLCQGEQPNFIADSE
ncbi:O-FucT domain-containing protein [Cephalotus follicularis]|uniref:O-fucosyltransferase family protein n=1 Tax=Cephalotus follicularis TaxID=3775 RepID=A0A1Q3D4E1_CEPFO|nr:O-FucT domain-containing protein [Cephalotus follicularis]